MKKYFLFSLESSISSSFKLHIFIKIISFRILISCFPFFCCIYRSETDVPNMKNCNIENNSSNQNNIENNSNKVVKKSSSSTSTIEDLEKLCSIEIASNPDPEITETNEQLELISRKRRFNDASVCGMNLTPIEDDYSPSKRKKFDFNLDLNQNTSNFNTCNSLENSLNNMITIFY